MKLGKFTLHSGGTVEVPRRIALLLWGRGGVGKTAFACTAPGKKLIINIDPDGYATIAHRPDVNIIRLDELNSMDLLKELNQGNPLGLDGYLRDNPDVETVILDSATVLYYHCLVKAVKEGIGQSRLFTPSMSTPGVSAYGARNANLLGCLIPLLTITARHNRHIVITSHQDTPVMAKDDKGNEYVSEIPIMLSDKVRENTTMRLSEIWYLSLESDVRKIAVAPTRLRSPMKSRMFSWPTGRPEFVLDYDDSVPDEEQEHTIANWYSQWLANGGKKIPLPTTTPRGK